MKLIGRTLAIIAAALAVAGVTLFLSQSSTVQGMFPSRTDHDRPEATAAVEGTSESSGVSAADPAQAERDEFEHEDRNGPSLFGAVEIVKNLVVIGIIVALVAWAPKLFSGGRRKEDGRPQSPPAAPSV